VASRGERARGREDGVEIMRLGAGIFIALHPTTPGLLLFPMLYVNCTVKSHYIRAQCVHYTPRQKHFYPLEFFLLPPRPPLPLPPPGVPPCPSLLLFFLRSAVRRETSPEFIRPRDTRRSNLSQLESNVRLAARYKDTLITRSFADRYPISSSVSCRCYPAESLFLSAAFVTVCARRGGRCNV